MNTWPGRSGVAHRGLYDQTGSRHDCARAPRYQPVPEVQSHEVPVLPCRGRRRLPSGAICRRSHRDEDQRFQDRSQECRRHRHSRRRRGERPSELGLDRATLDGAGFEGKIGQALVIPRAGGPAFIAVGFGSKEERGPTRSGTPPRPSPARRATTRTSPFPLPDLGSMAPVAAAQAIVEGVLLARYRYVRSSASTEQEPPLAELTIVVDGRHRSSG